LYLANNANPSFATSFPIYCPAKAIPLPGTLAPNQQAPK